METTISIWDAIEENTPLNCINGAKILMDVHEDKDDGTFPRVSEWTKFANRIDKDGITEYLNWIAGRNKTKIEQDGYIIFRETKWDNEAIIQFKEPITILFAFVGQEPITKTLSKIKGNFNYEWFWRNSGRQDKIANGIEVYFNITEYLQ